MDWFFFYRPRFNKNTFNGLVDGDPADLERKGAFADEVTRGTPIIFGLNAVVWFFVAFLAFVFVGGFIAYPIEKSLRSLRTSFENATLPEATFTSNYPTWRTGAPFSTSDLDMIATANMSYIKRGQRKEPTKFEQDAFATALRIMRGMTPQQWKGLNEKQVTTLKSGAITGMVKEIKAKAAPDDQLKLRYELWAILISRVPGYQYGEGNLDSTILHTLLQPAYRSYTTQELPNEFSSKQQEKFPGWWVFVAKFEKVLDFVAPSVRSRFGVVTVITCLLSMLLCCILLGKINAFRIAQSAPRLT